MIYNYHLYSLQNICDVTSPPPPLSIWHLQLPKLLRRERLLGANILLFSTYFFCSTFLSKISLLASYTPNNSYFCVKTTEKYGVFVRTLFERDFAYRGNCTWPTFSKTSFPCSYNVNKPWFGSHQILSSTKSKANELR